jgi:hypothetical protein
MDEGDENYLYQAALMTEDLQMHFMPALFREGAIWLIPAWISDIPSGLRRPAIAVRVADAKPTKARPGDHADLAIPGIVPKSVLAGQPSTDERFQVLQDDTLTQSGDWALPLQ